ncbi:MAG: DUF2515 family protein [Bacillota bacterium]
MKVRDANLNNVSRTACYIDFFKKYPEIHWSFLAHMVSRNAGYHIPTFEIICFHTPCPKKGKMRFSNFLSCVTQPFFKMRILNYYYMNSGKVRGILLFIFLKKFNVSIFMKSIWNNFLTMSNKHVLTIGLIMNGQHMIQKRILTGMKKPIEVEE